MDDIKRMIEKYKQELMEYSKAAAPQERMDFPEVIEDTAEDLPESAAVEYENSRESAEAHRDNAWTYSETESVRSDADDYLTDNKSETDCGARSDEIELPGEKLNCLGQPVDNSEPTVREEEVREMQPAQPAVNEQTKSARKPEIIGYVADGNDEALFDYENIFSDLLPQSGMSRAAARADSDLPNPEDMPSQRENSDENTENSRPSNNTDYSGTVSGVTDNTLNEPMPDFAETESVTPRQAEELTQRPISGQRPSEQLTGRSFEDTDGLPTNSRDDIRPLHDGTAPPDRPSGEPAYSDLQNFIPSEETEDFMESEENSPRSNNLRFRVYTARNALPIKGAVCAVRKRHNGKVITLHTLITDSSGQTPAIALPAPSASLSQTPDNTVQPYALYDATISADGFNTVEIRNIPIFEGVLSVQRVAMIPQTEENMTEIIDEQATNVNGGN